jgi:hypothetical protein
MGKSIRYVLRGQKGRVRQNFNWPEIRSNRAVVYITAGEVISNPAEQGPHFQGTGPWQDFMYNLGDADIWVSNISPHAGDHFSGEPGGVEFILHVIWDSPLDVGITIVVEDDEPLNIMGLDGQWTK